MTSSDIIAAIDIGSAKVSCALFRSTSPRTTNGESLPPLQLIGHASLASIGVVNGVIGDVEAFTQCLTAVVDQAERRSASPITVRRVTVNVSGSARVSTSVNELSIDNGRVLPVHRERLEQGAIDQAHRNGYTLVHHLSSRYGIDGDPALNPIGMYGRQLTIQLQTIQIVRARLQNLALAFTQSHLAIANIVYTPYASSLACLTPEQRDLGVVCIDMGAQTTSFVVFTDGILVHAGCIPVGGMHATNDIARGLALTIQTAERLKVREGSVTNASVSHQTITIPDDPSGGSRRVSREMLTTIIRARIEETLELVWRAATTTPDGQHLNLAGHQVVFTGGSNAIPGLLDLAAESLKIENVHLGSPQSSLLLPSSTAEPRANLAHRLRETAPAKKPDPRVARDHDDPSNTLPATTQEPITTVTLGLALFAAQNPILGRDHKSTVTRTMGQKIRRWWATHI